MDMDSSIDRDTFLLVPVPIELYPASAIQQCNAFFICKWSAYIFQCKCRLIYNSRNNVTICYFLLLSNTIFPSVFHYNLQVNISENIGIKPKHFWLHCFYISTICDGILYISQTLDICVIELSVFLLTSCWRWFLVEKWSF